MRRIMGKNQKTRRILALGLIVCTVLLSSCGKSTDVQEAYKDTTSEDGVVLEESTSAAAASDSVEETHVYEEAGVIDTCSGEYQSPDGLCIIKKMEHYYDVTLDYENGTPEEVGKAYAATVLEAYPEYEEVMEPYIYENIKAVYPNMGGQYNFLNDRLTALFDSLPESYREELASYADAISEGETGFSQNGQISYEEAVLLQMVPDALRGTACSALSLWGDKTVTGDRITYRSLEWRLGSKNQMCTAHAVVHMKNGEKTITSLNVLGLLDIVSAVNNDGVFVGILDVGLGGTYKFEDKKCYTYELRYALEEFDNATELGNYMVDNSGNFTFCHNIIISDENNSYCAEDAVKTVQDNGQAYSTLRDADTPLLEGLNWDSNDSLCVVNSFASEGNRDGFSNNSFNAVRFEKYNTWVSAQDKFSVADVKNMVTQEKRDEIEIAKVRPDNVYQQIIVDYNTKSIQVAFTGTEGVTDYPVFVEIGGWSVEE